jgi:hypothetical protein
LNPDVASNCEIAISLLGVVPSAALIPILIALLLASAVKVWRHQ